MGFFARLRERTNSGPGRLVAIFLALTVIAAAVMLMVRAGGGDSKLDAIRAHGRDADLICKSTGKSGRASVPFDAQPPYACPWCGKKDAMPALLCAGCKKLIENHVNTTWKCPNCGQEHATMTAP